jgi:hypothetical protein
MNSVVNSCNYTKLPEHPKHGDGCAKDLREREAGIAFTVRGFHQRIK